MVVRLGDSWRVILCADAHQWIVQRRRGAEWKARSFHRERLSLIAACSGEVRGATWDEIDGLGVALLADWTVDTDIEAGRLIDLLPGHEGSATEFDTCAWIVYPSRDHVPVRLRVLLDHLRTVRSPRPAAPD